MSKEKAVLTLYGLYNDVKSPGKQRVDKRAHRFYHDVDISILDGAAIINVEEYSRIFKVKPNRAKERFKRLSVVKITYDSKHVIYRKFWKTNNKSFNKGVAVTIHSLLFLSNDSGDMLGKKVTVERSSRFNYYWHHPNEIVQCSFLLGLLSIIMGLLSLLITVIAEFVDK